MRAGRVVAVARGFPLGLGWEAGTRTPKELVVEAPEVGLRPGNGVGTKCMLLETDPELSQEPPRWRDVVLCVADLALSDEVPAVARFRPVPRAGADPPLLRHRILAAVIR
jgi:hypothetical protein